MKGFPQGSLTRSSRAISLKYALGALRREVLEFRFSYPLDIVPQAGPKESLHYYLYSDKLSWSVMSMDPTGVPRARGRLYGEVYKPAYIAWWGLVNLGHYLQRNDTAGREIFLRQVDWLELHATTGPNGSVVWLNPYDYLEGDTLRTAPWISAYDQGMVISALVRGYRMTKRPKLMELLRGAHRIFEVDTRAGGVRTPAPGGATYAEIPGAPAPGILDGFLTSLLGLYDLSVETGDAQVERLFREGVQGLTALLPTWDYRQKWSWYATRAYLCPPAYHILNSSLLNVVARLSGEPALATLADRWSPEHLSRVDRVEIYLAFLLTKNWCRLRHRTWRQTQGRVHKLVRDAARLPVHAPLPTGSIAGSSD
jgi:D-glucuronyl C5-epimerase C-terminus